MSKCVTTQVKSAWFSVPQHHWSGSDASTIYEV